MGRFGQRVRNALVRLRGQALIPPGARIGSGVFIGSGARLDWSHGRHITIDDGATIVDGARILCHDASSYARIGATWVAPVRVGKRAFIGADALILPGVTVGDDAIVAAGSVVTKDVPEGVIVAGAPAREIGSTADLDAKRRAQMRSGTVFDESEFGAVGLDPERGARLDAAAANGGYFLARSDIANPGQR